MSGEEFDSLRSAKTAIMLCSLLCDSGLAEDELKAELLRMARVPAIARQLACILATDPVLARRFAGALFAARLTLQADAPMPPPIAGGEIA